MNILTISNLYPRPDAPNRGMFNLQLVQALAKKADVRVIVPVVGGCRGRGSEVRSQRSGGLSGGQEGTRLRQGSGAVFAALRDGRRKTEDGSQRSEIGCSGGLPEGQPQSDCRVTYLPVRHIPFFGRNMAARFHEAALRSEKAQIAEADVILASWLYPDGVAAARLGAELNVPVWIMVLGSDVFHLKNKARRSMIQDACRKATGVICVAQHLKDALVDAGVDESKVHVVPNGVDTKVFSPAENFCDKCNRTSLKSFAGREVTGEKDESGSASGGKTVRRERIRLWRKDRRPKTEVRGRTSEDGTQQPATNNQQLAADGRLSAVLWVGNMVEVKDPMAMLEVWEIALQGRARTKEDSLWRKERGQRSEVGGQNCEIARLRDCGIAGCREDCRPAQPLTTEQPGNLTTDLRLVFIGDGPLRKRLEQRVKKMGLGDSVEFAGSLPQEAVAERMRKARALCLTSLTEGMPNVVLEALASGVPVVASDVGAVRDMLKDYDWCRVVARGERFADNFAEAVMEVLKNGRGDAAAVKLRSWDDVAAEIMDLMQCGGEDYRP